ncbi:hypothetical protein LR48_Vigan07g081900 [Vigna angularis]|uniref:Uncharacterized protein n=1 Tax=Phaseolus angularis TaxID=3914 RepID=A0A0L9UW80_PHAAN|nr:hypothetical protein LR48_Vigan07g081900 [Vigna angularis]
MRWSESEMEMQLQPMEQERSPKREMCGQWWRYNNVQREKNPTQMEDREHRSMVERVTSKGKKEEDEREKFNSNDGLRASFNGRERVTSKDIKEEDEREWR